MHQTQIAPQILQEYLDSAANAAQKGQAQFFTPIEWAELLCRPLPQWRSNVTDISCGAGHLLRAAENESTELLFGVEIQPLRSVPGRKTLAAPKAVDRVTGDLTRLYPLLRTVDFTSDLFVLNPPWDLHWYRDRLAGLAQSHVPAVREAFAALDSRTPRECLDSTVASLCIA